VSDKDPAAIRQFLQRDLDAYALRAGGHQADGLITGYYEPIYAGSLTRTDKATVPVYGTPDDLVVVQLDSLYPELKGKRLRGRVEGKVLKPYDDAGTIAAKGAKAPVLAWLTDPMDLQLLQIQGPAACAWPMASRCVWPMRNRMATPTAPSGAGWWTRAS
jgi:membrane-bound lytic murein transglycosylase A